MALTETGRAARKTSRMLDRRHQLCSNAGAKMAYVGVSCEVNRGLGERLMAPDENLFFARRLGLGLRAGETITGSVRDWAVDQISVIPALDFYGPAGV